MNESMNDEGDCRTAPATPGLLINTCYLGGEGEWVRFKVLSVQQ